MNENFTIVRNGFRIIGPKNPTRNSYIRTHVTILDDRYGTDSNLAWADAVDEVYRIYGAMPTEDNTVGQIAQTCGVSGQYNGKPVKDRSFQLSCNLYGKKVRELHKRIENAIK